MKVENMINDYKNTPNEEKENFIKHRITDKYIPYSKKIDVCNDLVDLTTSKVINGEKIYCIKSPAKFMLFNMTLINLYTDIDVDFDNILNDFDLLEENDLTSKMISNIPAAEYERFKMLLNMIESDHYENSRSVSALISNGIYKIKNVFKVFKETASGILSEALNDKEIAESIKKAFESAKNMGDKNGEKPNT